jgi:hypothetical protein
MSDKQLQCLASMYLCIMETAGKQGVQLVPWGIRYWCMLSEGQCTGYICASVKLGILTLEPLTRSFPETLEPDLQIQIGEAVQKTGGILTMSHSASKIVPLGCS